jgi:hypothetical protein
LYRRPCRQRPERPRGRERVGPFGAAESTTCEHTAFACNRHWAGNDELTAFGKRDVEIRTPLHRRDARSAHHKGSADERVGSGVGEGALDHPLGVRAHHVGFVVCVGGGRVGFVVVRVGSGGVGFAVVCAGGGGIRAAVGFAGAGDDRFGASGIRAAVGFAGAGDDRFCARSGGVGSAFLSLGAVDYSDERSCVDSTDARIADCAGFADERARRGFDELDDDVVVLTIAADDPLDDVDSVGGSWRIRGVGSG